MIAESAQSSRIESSSGQLPPPDFLAVADFMADVVHPSQTTTRELAPEDPLVLRANQNLSVWHLQGVRAMSLDPVLIETMHLGDTASAVVNGSSESNLTIVFRNPRPWVRYNHIFHISKDTKSGKPDEPSKFKIEHGPGESFDKPWGRRIVPAHNMKNFRAATAEETVALFDTLRAVQEPRESRF